MSSFFSDLQRGLWRESYWYEDLSCDVFRKRNLSDLLLPMCLFEQSSWQNVKGKGAEFQSRIFFIHLSLLFSGQSLNYWFVEEATRVHFGLCQSQTIVYHDSALFFRQASFWPKANYISESRMEKKCWSGEDKVLTDFAWFTQHLSSTNQLSVDLFTCTLRSGPSTSLQKAR